MGKKEQDINLLHIYGQEQWHGNAYIIGNKGGLLELKKAIEQALSDNKGEIGDDKPVYANDGEGYQTKVMMNNTGWLESFWGRLAVPYTAEVASDKREDAVWPWQI